MPTYLNVPFPEKDEAKRLGARWDGARKRWFVPDGTDLDPFARWLPVAEAGAAPLSEPDKIVDLGLFRQHVEEQQQEERGVGLQAYLAGVAEVVREYAGRPQWIRAEISFLSHKKHLYLDLVEHDANRTQVAYAKGCIWASDVAKLQKKFRDGTGGDLAANIKVLVLARGEFHPRFGFALIISDIDPSFTLGDLEAKLRDIRNALHQEGIYGNNRLLAVPEEFTRVAVIAPEQAAGLGDFRREADALQQYGLCDFTYFYAWFQGEGAVASIAQQFELVVAAHKKQPFDALIVIRGGGAKTDLAWLNDLTLARHICTAPLPVFTGIGHERDNTILDEVCCRRFDTPSKTVAFVEQVIVTSAQQGLADWKFIRSTARNIVSETQRQTEKAARTVADAARTALERARQGSERAAATVRRQAQVLTERAAGIIARRRGEVLAQVRRRLDAATERLARWRQDVARGAARQVEAAQREVDARWRLVEAVRPERTLRRGFAIVRAGKSIVGSRDAAAKLPRFDIEFRDGQLTVRPEQD